MPKKRPITGRMFLHCSDVATCPWSSKETPKELLGVWRECLDKARLEGPPTRYDYPAALRDYLSRPNTCPICRADWMAKMLTGTLHTVWIHPK